MIKCPHCYRTVPDGVLKCPHCHGNIVVRRSATPGTPARGAARGPQGGVVVFAVILGVVVLAGGGLWLAWPSLAALLTPNPRPAEPAAVPASGGAATAVPQANEVQVVTPRPPQGWRQIGGMQERFALWVPDTWRTYQAGIDFPDEWRALMQGLDPRLAEYLATGEVAALLADGATRAIAVRAPRGIAEGQFWPDSIYVRAREDLVGRTPAEVQPEFEAQLNDAYGQRALDLITSGLPTLSSGPAYKAEYTWNQPTARGIDVRLHAVLLIVFDDEMVYELRLESSEANYANSHAQAYQKVVSSFRFSTPEKEADLELPAGWRVVDLAQTGYVIWTPEDWPTYHAGADDLQNWMQQVTESYVRGSQYLSAAAAGVERATVVALEPTERRNDSFILGTIQVSVEPDLGGMSSGMLAEVLRQPPAQPAGTDWHVVQSGSRWHNGHPAAYVEATLSVQPGPGQPAVPQHVQILVLADSPGPLVLRLACAESQYEQFRATFELVLNSFRAAP